VFDAELSATVSCHFERAYENSHEVTFQEIEEDPIAIKLRDNFARLFSPYL
jgi:cardiolipin synthase